MTWNLTSERTFWTWSSETHVAPYMSCETVYFGAISISQIWWKCGWLDYTRFQADLEDLGVSLPQICCLVHGHTIAWFVSSLLSITRCWTVVVCSRFLLDISFSLLRVVKMASHGNSNFLYRLPKWASLLRLKLLQQDWDSKRIMIRSYCCNHAVAQGLTGRFLAWRGLEDQECLPR